MWDFEGLIFCTLVPIMSTIEEPPLSADTTFEADSSSTGCSSYDDILERFQKTFNDEEFNAFLMERPRICQPGMLIPPPPVESDDEEMENIGELFIEIPKSPAPILGCPQDIFGLIYDEEMNQVQC